MSSNFTNCQPFCFIMLKKQKKTIEPPPHQKKTKLFLKKKTRNKMKTERTKGKNNKWMYSAEEKKIHVQLAVTWVRRSR